MDPARKRFEAVYDAWGGLILAYAARRTSCPADAADVVAETFLVAWRRIDDMPDGDEARPWLYGVARRVLANQRRGARRRERLDVRLGSQVATLVESASTDAPDAATIGLAFAALGEDDREVLTLVGWDGIARDELAVVLGCTRATARVRLHRARRRFERELAALGVQRLARAGHGSAGWALAHPDPEDTR